MSKMMKSFAAALAVAMGLLAIPVTEASARSNKVIVLDGHHGQRHGQRIQRRVFRDPGDHRFSDSRRGRRAERIREERRQERRHDRRNDSGLVIRIN